MPTCPAGHASASGDFCDVCGMRIGASASTGGAPPERQPSVPTEPCPQCGTAKSGRFCESCGFDFDAGRTTAARAVPGGAGDGAAGDGAAGDGAAEGGAAAEGTGAAQPGVGPAPAPGDPAVARGPAPAPSGPPPAPSGPAAPGDPARAASGPVAWTAVVASDHAYFEDVVAAGGPDAATLEFPDYCPERRFRLAGPEMRIGRRSVSQGLEPEIDLTGPPTDPGVSRLHAVLIAQPDGSWAILDPGSENGTAVNGSEITAGTRVPLHEGDRIHIGAWTVITIHVG
jgi:FHA domain